MTARISINKVHFPVTTLGYGKRVGIWTQGCSIHCPSCISRDTWDFRHDRAVAIDRFLAALDHWLSRADGVTISGGEPFDQAPALADLVQELRRRQSGDILVFSGHSSELLFRLHAQILGNIDVLISEPYRPEAGTALMLRGSDNQRITLLSDLARKRYPIDLDSRPWDRPRRLDLMMDGETVWMAGIPRPGEIAELKLRLANLGLASTSSEQPEVFVRA